MTQTYFFSYFISYVCTFWGPGPRAQNGGMGQALGRARAGISAALRSIVIVQVGKLSTKKNTHAANPEGADIIHMTTRGIICVDFKFTRV